MISRRTIVDERYEEGAAVVTKLLNDGSISEAQSLQDTLRRTLVVGAASLFEQQLKDAILRFASIRSRDDSAIVSIVKMSLIDRGFHTMFQWQGKNANSFFSFFGSEMGDAMRKKCSSDYKGPVESFLEIGNLRNCIVHQNFHVFYFEKTLDECYASYQIAKKFVDFVLESLDA